MEELQRRENREGLPPSPVEVSQLCIIRHQRDKGGGRRMSDCPNREERTQDRQYNLESDRQGRVGSLGISWKPSRESSFLCWSCRCLSSTKKVEKLDIGQISPP